MFLVCREQLIREAVGAALLNHGVRTQNTDLPSDPGQFRALWRALQPDPHDVGLLVTDLQDAAVVRDVTALVASVDIPWIVLTSTPSGPIWGAVLEAGAHDVVSADTPLDALAGLLDGVAEGGHALTDEERSSLIGAWGELGQGEVSVHRLIALTPREMEILTALHDGQTVAEIAESAGVSAGTVRGQVKSLLHKLEVGSQLEAVASYQQANDALLDEGAPGEPPAH